eukprot:COSAG02_NODE_295_length_25421_cov_88.063226_8_plen_91_part_00
MTLWALDRTTFRSMVMGQAINKRSKHSKFLEGVKLLSTLDSVGARNSYRQHGRSVAVVARKQQPPRTATCAIILLRRDMALYNSYILVNL